ncbi:MAG TPA: DUF982 domain-containing protein [Schlesneria sp.]
MDKVLNVDFHVTWTAPVFVQIGNGIRERIDGPEAALAALLHRWPSAIGKEFDLAKRRCSDAIIRHGSAEVARSAFVDAALTAKVFA